MDDRRIRVAALAAMVLLAASLQMQLWGWEVEDAALDFTYARNLANGWGLVAQVGAERVEGFSNPLWVALEAALQWLGADPFVVSRWLGLILGCGAVPLVYLAVRPVAKDPPYGPLAAAGAVAMFAPHAIWSQSGLENPLFSFLLALACYRAGRAGDRDVLGPLIFVLISLTRPEGVVYAVAAAVTAAASARGPYSARTRLLTWAVVLLVPLVAFEGARLWYFAQEFPATYYAKVGNSDVQVLDQANRGWAQIGGLARDTGLAAVVPLMVFGASGATGWRAQAAAVVSTVFLFAVALNWTMFATLVVLLALPILSISRKPPIGLAVVLVTVGLAVHLGAGGDWMRGYRYLSLLAVPGAVLVGTGAGELADRIDQLRHAPLLALGCAAVPQILYVARYAADPELDPQTVEHRLDAYLAIGRRLQLERRPRVVDHDMGGLLYYGADEIWVRDSRGVVDLPFAFYGADHDVVEHELFRDHPFDLTNDRGPTAAVLRGHAKFTGDYVEVDPAGYVRRDLFLPAKWDGPQVHAGFADGVQLLGIAIASPQVAADGGLYVEVGTTAGRGDPYRMLLVLTDGARVQATWDLPPAYDWVPVADWADDEVFHGRFSLPLPEGLPLGDYGIALVVVDGKGAVVPALSADAPAYRPVTPVLAKGEIRIDHAVRVVPSEENQRLALANRSDALRLADAGECEDAEQSWLLASHQRSRAPEWREANVQAVARALSTCWADRAAKGSMEGDALLGRVRELERARDWDPREPALWEVGHRVGEEAHQRAAASDLVRVRFLWAEAAVRADPTRSWDRRMAEKSRRTWSDGTPNRGDEP